MCCATCTFLQQTKTMCKTWLKPESSRCVLPARPGPSLLCHTLGASSPPLCLNPAALSWQPRPPDTFPIPDTAALRLRAFAFAVPSAQNALPPGNPMTCVVTSFRSLFKCHPRREVLSGSNLKLYTSTLNTHTHPQLSPHSCFFLTIPVSIDNIPHSFLF